MMCFFSVLKVKAKDQFDNSVYTSTDKFDDYLYRLILFMIVYYACMFVFNLWCCLGSITAACWFWSTITARGDFGEVTRGVGAEHWLYFFFVFKSNQVSVSGTVVHNQKNELLESMPNWINSCIYTLQVFTLICLTSCCSSHAWTKVYVFHPWPTPTTVQAAGTPATPVGSKRAGIPASPESSAPPEPECKKQKLSDEVESEGKGTEHPEDDGTNNIPPKSSDSGGSGTPVEPKAVRLGQLTRRQARFMKFKSVFLLFIHMILSIDITVRKMESTL